MKQLLFVLAVALLLLTGCPGTLPLVKTEYVVIKPAKEMVQDCAVQAPPDVELYVAASPAEKEALLYSFSDTQMNNIAKCNKQWQLLRFWIDQQVLLYTDK